MVASAGQRGGQRGGGHGALQGCAWLCTYSHQIAPLRVDCSQAALVVARAMKYELASRQLCRTEFVVSCSGSG